MKPRVLITGAAGFIGSHFCEHYLKNTDWEFLLMVRLGKVGNLRRLVDMDCWAENEGRVTVLWHDLRSPISPAVRRALGSIDIVLHLAAETHVDRSITEPRDFITSNVIGTANLLDWARYDADRFLLFSTDEVYGPAAPGVQHTEEAPYNATNPYSATKAGAEQLVNAYANCYDMRCLVTSTMNNFGERQDPEKMIPMTIRKVLKGEKVTIHADSTKTISGSRFYIHARNTADAVLFILRNAPVVGRKAERYNIVGEREVTNLNLAKMIADVVGKPLNYEMVNWHTSSRPGHDLRYALDGTKLATLGWTPPVGFESSLEKTVRWTLDHPDCLLT
jgi:dTDP-glucose 4,6-dehydratase